MQWSTSKWCLALMILLLLTLTSVSFASKIPTTEKTPQAILGDQYIVTGFYSIVPSDGLQITGVSQSATPAAYWIKDSVANTALTAGHWQYAVTVQINEGALPNTIYTVTLKSGSAAAWGLLGSIEFETPDTITPGDKMTFVFDVGSSIDNAVAFIATVQ